MTDYEELVKALRHLSTGRCDSCKCELCAIYETCLTRCVLDAAAAIEALQADMKTYGDTAFKEGYEMGFAAGEARAEKRMEPKHGEWVEENRRPRSSQFVCSLCHRTAYDPQPSRDKAWRKRCRYSYCPNCGAKMEVQDGNK